MKTHGHDQRPERHHATMLFAELSGFTSISEHSDAEQAYGHVTACIMLLDGILRRHAGSVDKFLGDSLLAMFGHPVPLAAPASSALNAALEMVQCVEQYNRRAELEVPLGLAIGINTGPVVVGDSGGPAVREFHVLGDTVNTAARLKGRAPEGRIYIGAETAAEVGDSFETLSLEPMKLKGKERPVPVYEVTSVRHGTSAVESQPLIGRMIGRGAELGRLEECASRLAGGHGGVVEVIGAEGIGKSRLLAEFVGTVDPDSIDIHRSAASPLARDEPFHLVAGLAAESDPRSEGFARTVAARVRRRAEKKPMLVILDKLQWADAASLEVVSTLGRLAAECPILLVVASRSGTGAFERAQSASAAEPYCENFETIELEALRDTDARALVSEVLGVDSAQSAAREIVVERGSGNPRQLITSCFLAGVLRSETERERGEDERSSETERRRSTVLFADLTGFTSMSEKMEPEELYPIVSDALALVDEIARRYGGTVDKHLGDCVLALFGVPSAVEDAPRAAVNAAIEMIQAVQKYSEEHRLDLPLDLHVGVNTGLGIAGEISGPLIREFALMGEAVDIASQLTDHAKRGQIFVGPETHRFTHDAFEYRAAEPLRAKGRADSVPTFELVSRETQLHRARVGSARRIFAPLVGRDPEMQLLVDAVEQLRDGGGRIVSLVAEAGIGKSRLVAELAERLAESDRRLIEGRALSSGARRSYHLFADLSRDWAEIGEKDDEDSARRRLEEVVTAIAGDESEEIVPLVAAVAGVELAPGERERLDRMPAESREQLIRGAITQLFRLGSRDAPLVVVLDDLHWADQSSIELLESLLRLVEQHPILFLQVFRPGYAETSERIRETARRDHSERYREIDLQPLDSASARELIKSLFHRGDVPHATRVLIEEKSKGNPFFIEEVARSLLDEGAVEIDERGRLRATEKIHSVVIPGTVQEVIMARVDRLPAGRKSLLRAASVAGQSFYHEVLEEFETDPDELEQELGNLLAAEFLVRDDGSYGTQYAFKHPLIQEVTYEGILSTRRQELHVTVAESIETRLGSGVPGVDGMLAYHFSMGRDSERAEKYLFRAGDEAARVAASSEALHFFREASRLYFDIHGEGGDPLKKAVLEKNVGLALYNRGRLIEADEHFNGALRYFGEKVPSGSRGVGLRFVRNLALIVTALYVPTLRGRRAAGEVDREVIDLMLKRAEAQTTASPRRFVFDSVDSVARLDRVDAATIVGSGAMYAGNVGIFSYGGLSFRLGRRFLERAEGLVNENDAKEFLFYRVMNFVHHFLEGDWSDEHEVSDEALREGLRGGGLWPVTSFLNLHALKQIYQGRYDRARDRIDWLREIAERYEHDLAASAASALTGILHLKRRELPEAVRALNSYYDDHPEEPFKISALGSRMVAELLWGDIEAAEESRERAQRFLDEAGRVLPYHLSSFLRARYELDVVQLENAGAVWRLRWRAWKSRRAALRIAGRVAWRRPEVFRTAGRHDWVLGRQQSARRWWKRAISECERLGTAADLARTHLLVARYAGAAGVSGLEGRSADEHMALARSGLQKLGLGRELDGLERPAAET